MLSEKNGDLSQCLEGIFARYIFHKLFYPYPSMYSTPKNLQDIRTSMLWKLRVMPDTESSRELETVVGEFTGVETREFCFKTGNCKMTNTGKLHNSGNPSSWIVKICILLNISTYFIPDPIRRCRYQEIGMISHDLNALKIKWRLTFGYKALTNVKK